MRPAHAPHQIEPGTKYDNATHNGGKMDAALAGAGLFALILFARSIRGGFSGPLASWLSLLQIPAAAASVWLLALTLSWWTVAYFIGASLLVGGLVNRNNLAIWVSLEPISGLLAVLLPAAGWTVRYLH